MKTKEKILDDLVIERSSCDSFPEYIKHATIGSIENLVNDAMKEFALEVAKEALRNASENATITGNWDSEICDVIHSVNKESILSHDNIPEL
ncbi:hypothetical protein [Sphingobacterium sp.]|uniref:hypothetical protein n=1 Tax=Sphingobacterium sp. TaxID=341027 RepID=UPI00289D8DF6|nr:hypothetical protein [Sphingobacterium sp.]